jgi:hypothetical protein
LINYLSGADEAPQKNRVFDRETNVDTIEPSAPTPKTVEDIDDYFSQLSAGAELTADLLDSFPRLGGIAEARVDALLRVAKQFEADLVSRMQPDPAPSPAFRSDSASPCVSAQEQPHGNRCEFLVQANDPLGARLKDNGPKWEKTLGDYLLTVVFASALYQGLAMKAASPWRATRKIHPASPSNPDGPKDLW